MYWISKQVGTQLKEMEIIRTIVGVFVSCFAFTFGIMSTLSLLLLATSIGLHNDSEDSEGSASSLLISFAMIEVINVIKNTFVSCRATVKERPSGWVLAWLLLSTALSASGSSILIFYVLPRVDMFRGAMLLLSFGLLPWVSRIVLSWTRCLPKRRLWLVLAIFMQLAAIVILIAHDFSSVSFFPQPNGTFTRLSSSWGVFSLDSLAVLASILLVPVEWLKNYIDTDICVAGWRVPLVGFKAKLSLCHPRASIILPVWRAIWILSFALILVPGLRHLTTQRHTENPATYRSAPFILKEIESLLAVDEQANFKFEPLFEQRFLQPGPLSVPRRNFEPVTMVPHDRVMHYLSSLLAASASNKLAIKSDELTDKLLEQGRYSKKTKSKIAEFLQLIQSPEQKEVSTLSMDRRILITVLVCSSVITMLLAKAAFKWNIYRFVILVPMSLLTPFTLVLISQQCKSPVIAVELFKCMESWSLASAPTAAILFIWVFSQWFLASDTWRENNAANVYQEDVPLSLLVIPELLYSQSISSYRITPSQPKAENVNRVMSKKTGRNGNTKPRSQSSLLTALADAPKVMQKTEYGKTEHISQ